MSNQRNRKVDEAIRTFVGQKVGRLKDPRIGMVTITDVRTTGDLSRAEVFYTCLPDDAEAAEATATGLASAAPMLRRDLGGVLKARSIPELVFVHDPVPEQGRHIESLVTEVRAADEARNRGDGGDG